MDFRHITPSDYPELKPFFQKQRYRLCYYSLPSILTWSNHIYQPYGLIEDDTLVIAVEYATRVDDRHLMLPVSPAREYNPEELLKLALRLGFDTYRHVSDEYVTRFGEDRIEPFFNVREQEGYADYLYLTENMATLKGRKYSKKRNLINQFRRDYLDEGRVETEPVTSSSTSDIMDFLERWYVEHDMPVDEDEDLVCEKEAIASNMANIDLLGTPGIVLRIDGEIRGFGLGAPLTEDTGVLHYEKAYSRIKGLYQYLDSLCARLFLKGCKYISKENDMKHPGLTQAKRSYYPVRMVKSYQLTVRPQSSGV